MRRIVTVIGAARWRWAVLSCGHRVPARSESDYQIGTGYLLCAVCAGRNNKTA
jgi:hypothetical protein